MKSGDEKIDEPDADAVKEHETEADGYDEEEKDGHDDIEEEPFKDSLEDSFVSEAEAEINEDPNIRRRRDTSDILKEAKHESKDSNLQEKEIELSPESDAVQQTQAQQPALNAAPLVAQPA